MTSSKKLSSRDHKTDIQMNSLERGSISQTFPGPSQMGVSALREQSGHGAPFLTKKLSAIALAKENQFSPMIHHWLYIYSNRLTQAQEYVANTKMNSMAFL